MIKFFRKIRQNMIKENKVSNYLIYAVGEILLLVIGILIALQLNTWQIEKKDQLIEKTLLKNIKRDLESNLQELNVVKRFKISQNKAGSRLLEYIIDASKPLEDTIQFVNDFHIINYFIIPTSNRTSYDLATSTGYLNHITNDSLTNELSRYFSDIKIELNVTDTKRYINSFIESHIMNNYPMFSKHVMPIDGQGGKYALEKYRNDNRPILQPNNIRGDISFENHLNLLSVRHIIGIKKIEEEEKWIHGLIHKIENQLNLKE